MKAFSTAKQFVTTPKWFESTPQEFVTTLKEFGSIPKGIWSAAQRLSRSISKNGYIYTGKCYNSSEQSALFEISAKCSDGW